MERLMNATSTSPQVLAWAATAVVTLVTLSIVAYQKQTKTSVQNKTAIELPPMAPGGFLFTIRKFFSKDLHHWLLELSREQGKVVRIPLNPPPHPCFCIVSDHTLARRILDDAASTKWRNSYRIFDDAFGGTSFFSAEGDRYKHTRKNHSVALGPRFQDIMTDITNQVLDEWMEEKFGVGDSSVEELEMNVAQEIQVLTAAVIGRVAFGYDLSHDDRRLMVRSLELAYVEAFVDSQRNPLRKLLPFMYAGKKRARQATRDLQGMCRKMLFRQQRRNQQEEPVSTTKMMNTSDSLLVFMIEDQDYENDEERVADMVAYLAGGFETVGYTMAFTMLELAKNPDTQSTLRRHLREEDSEKDRMQCDYLKYVTRESMRLHPVAAAGPIRVTSKAFQYYPNEKNEDGTSKMSSSCLTIPKNSIVIMPFYAMHHDDQVFEHPEQFLPERWESPTSNMQSSWMGFSTGRRNCKGQLLAYIEMQLVLARLVGEEYEWSVVEEGRSEYSVTLKTIGTILKAKKRR